MLVREMKGVSETYLLAQSPLWNREVDKILPLDLDAFIRSHYGTTNYYRAIREVEAMYASWNEGQCGENPHLVRYTAAPRQRITINELVDWLKETTTVRRRALLFALESDLSIQSVINLTWKDMQALKGLSQFALQIANSNPRHLRIGYVFWETMQNNAAGPLFGLADTALEVSQGMGFEALRALYKNILPYDTDSDLSHFTQQIAIALGTIK